VYQLPELTELAKAIVAKGLDIWMYTGFKFEQLLKMEGAKELLNCVSVVVDGEFKIAQRDVSLLFRGSANQRLIDVAGSLALGKVKELDL
ncbi:MAG: radical SAM protein, partial [Muribaculaceae bacterium]|nr:radical SAM protein [Muribaculaceae bacterium]